MFFKKIKRDLIIIDKLKKKVLKEYY